jgi:hypothetical protein
MNNLPILFFFLIALISCTYNNIAKPEKKGINPEQPEKWQLIEMSGSIANVPPLTGSDMDWQEWYVFNRDHSFTKTRVRNNATTSANGIYSVVTLSGEQFLELTYPTGNELIGNCTAEAKELLSIESEDELASTWRMCDGPGLIYKKVKNNDVEESGH